MKNLANCNPIEFLTQGYKVIDAAKELLAASKVLDIRKRKPTLTGAETEEEAKEAYREQARKNINDMLAALMQENPKKTAEVLGLMCFIDPADIENHKGVEFITPALELFTNKEVLNFLSSLTSAT